MLLNVFLPIALTKGELAKYKKHIDDLDALRRVPNDIMHCLMNRETRGERLRRGLSAIAVGNHSDLKVLSQTDDVLGEILATQPL